MVNLVKMSLLQPQIANQYTNKQQENNRILPQSHNLVTQKYPFGYVKYGWVVPDPSASMKHLSGSRLIQFISVNKLK